MINNIKDRLIKEISKCIIVMYSISTKHSIDLIDYCTKYKCLLTQDNLNINYKKCIELINKEDVINNIKDEPEWILINIIKLYRGIIGRLNIRHSTEESKSYLNNCKHLHELSRGVKIRGRGKYYEEK